MFLKYFRIKKLLNLLDIKIIKFKKSEYFDMPINGLSEDLAKEIYSNSFGFSNYSELINCIKNNPFDKKLDFILEDKYNKTLLVNNILNYSENNYNKIFKNFLINNTNFISLITNINPNDYTEKELIHLLDINIPEQYYNLYKNRFDLFIYLNKLDSIYEIKNSYDKEIQKNIISRITNKKIIKRSFLSGYLYDHNINELNKIKEILSQNNITTIFFTKNKTNSNSFSLINQESKTSFLQKLKYNNYNEVYIKKEMSIFEYIRHNLFSENLFQVSKFSEELLLIKKNKISFNNNPIYIIIEDITGLQSSDVVVISQMRALGIYFIFLVDEYSLKLNNNTQFTNSFRANIKDLNPIDEFDNQTTKKIGIR